MPRQATGGGADAALPAEACGPDATCVNRPSGQGYVCRCLLGKHGEKCMAGEWRGGAGRPAVCVCVGGGHGQEKSQLIPPYSVPQAPQ